MMFQSQQHPLLLSCFILTTVTSTIVGTTSISLGTTLYASNTNQSWSSSNNTFFLRFIPFHHQTSPPSFIAAVVYTGGSPVIWYAGNSAVDSGGSLRFLPTGNLRLVNGSGSIVWDSGTSHMGVSSVMLHDNGNLVLSNGTGSVWSSFDNPTDTIVPSQNFTLSKVLRSGLYSFSVVRSGNLTLKWSDSVPYWDQDFASSMSVVNFSSPFWRLESDGILQLFDPNLTSPLVVAYSNNYAEGNDVLRILKLDGDGNLRIYSSKRGTGIVTVTWVAVKDQCEVFGYCGSNGICSYNDSNPICGCPSQNFEMVDLNDSRKGCKRKVRLEDCVGKVAMLQVDHARFLTYPPQFLINPEIFFIGISACRGNCLAASSCFASTSLSDGTGLCYIKTTDFISGYQNPSLPSTSYIKVCGPLAPNSSPLKDAEEGKDRKINAWVVALVVLSTLLGFLAFEGGLWFWCRRNSSRFGVFAAHYALLEYASGAPVHFSYKELQRSTEGFKDKVGDGGFGAVYKGNLANQTVVAVKQLEGIEQGEKQFRMEVSTISSTHHLNLVRLIGFCSEGRHRLLVYEFMKNGSLDNFIFVNKEQSGKLLNWEYRFNIALGAARGLTYLHEECRNCIVHCDVKPENILLDENYNAKVSDFGLAKLSSVMDHRHRTLTSVRGTRGYLAPEWLANLPITSKSDVYSYGMVLLEIVSGRRNFEISDDKRKFSIWACEELEKGNNIMGIIDRRLVSQEVNLEQAKRMLLACFWCIQEHPSQRPTMSKVVQMLEGVTDIDRPPAPRSISVGSSCVIGSNATAVSTNTISSTSNCSPSSSLLT